MDLAALAIMVGSGLVIACLHWVRSNRMREKVIVALLAFFVVAGGVVQCASLSGNRKAIAEQNELLLACAAGVEEGEADRWRERYLDHLREASGPQAAAEAKEWLRDLDENVGEQIERMEEIDDVNSEKRKELEARWWPTYHFVVDQFDARVAELVEERIATLNDRSWFGAGLGTPDFGEPPHLVHLIGEQTSLWYARSVGLGNGVYLFVRVYPAVLRAGAIEGQPQVEVLARTAGRRTYGFSVHFLGEGARIEGRSTDVFNRRVEAFTSSAGVAIEDEEFAGRVSLAIDRVLTHGVAHSRKGIGAGK